MVNLPSLISFTYLASVGLAPHRPSRLFGKLDASRHLMAPCAIAGEATATAPLVTARRAKLRREMVMQSSLSRRGLWRSLCYYPILAALPGGSIAGVGHGRSTNGPETGPRASQRGGEARSTGKDP